MEKKYIMKKRIILPFVLISIIFMLNRAAGAVEISAGATTWYSCWDFEQSNSSTEFDPTFLYGPALSMKFSDDYNLTFVFLFGKFDMSETHSDGTYTRELKRYDSDLALNYRLNSYFKLFAGGKYMAYEMSDFTHRAAGPGAGISAVLPLVSNLYLLGNISGLYLWGKHKQENETEGTTTDDYTEYGMNSNLSLAYYITSASVTLSMGGRYQYLKSDFKDAEDQDDLTHQFYGFTAAATYSFSL